MDNTFTVQLAEPELHYLRSLLGLPRPHSEDAGKQENSTMSEQAVQSMQQNLAAKYYLQLPAAKGGIVALDQTVATLLGAASFPQHGLAARVLREKSAEPEELQLLEAGELLVEVGREATGAYNLIACRTHEVALERLLTFLGLKQQPMAHQESFRIAAEDMTQVPYIIAGNGPEDGAVFLQENGAPEKVATRLARALDNPVRQSLIQAITWSDGQPTEVGRLMLLEEVYGLWLIAPAAEDSTVLEVIPCSAKAAVARIRELASSVLLADAE